MDPLTTLVNLVSSTTGVGAPRQSDPGAWRAVASPFGHFDSALPYVRGVVAEPPGSALSRVHHGEAGNRFVGPVPTDLPKLPIRVYASLASAPTPEARVDAVMHELERRGAFNRRYLFVGIPTGGGHVNPVALETTERLAGGDIASVAIQFGTLPSFMSIGKVDDSRELHAMLIRRIKQRSQQLHPGGGGPKVLLYGESLGAWACEDLISRSARHHGDAGGAGKLGLAHGSPLEELGIDRVALLGVPGLAKFDRGTLGPGGMQAVASVGELRMLGRRERREARVWELTHHDDPVHRMDLSLIWRRPESGPDHDHWKPVITFAQAFVGIVRDRTHAKPGEFTAETHDYRLELPRMLRDAFGFDGVDDRRLARIAEQVRRSETWIMSQDWTRLADDGSITAPAAAPAAKA